MTGQISPKSRLATALLCWFFGQLGVHRFYLGKYKTAIVLLILTTFGWSTAWTLGFGFLSIIPVGIWVLADLIMVILGVMKDKDAKPIKRWIKH